jgi:hypothetical protein
MVCLGNICINTLHKDDDNNNNNNIITDAECGSRSDTSNNRGNWNDLKISRKIPEQHAGESTNSRNYQKKKIAILGTAAPPHCGKC